MESWRQRRANQIVIITLALLVGVAVGQLRLMVPVALAMVLAVLILVVLRPYLGLAGLCVLGFGVWRGASTNFSHTLLASQIRK
jgi:hypothetical protein